mmetsp:Transcript_55246/g.164478  ORF Transcript_55246/g.164478 Transcript_55246/m.164478 type:complete len:384 (-) Transcript_55246:273-1424(-)
MDPGQDLDDEMFLVMLSALSARGLVRCLGVVCTLEPATIRAQLARGTLNELGLHEVPVAAGSDGGASGRVEELKKEVTYLTPVPQMSGMQLMINVLQEAAPHSVSLVLISSLKDAADLLREHEALFAERVKEVVIQGGVKATEDPSGGSSSEPFFLEPDTAHNNMFDEGSSRFLYRRCQELGVPLVVLSRHAAYACQMPRAIYDDMAGTGSVIGKQLQQRQAQSIEQLWRRACAPDGSEAREGLPARCNKAWFCDTFCRGKGAERDGSQPIWDLVSSFNMYDPLALLLATPQLAHFFNPEIVVVGETEHWVVGTSKEVPGVADSVGLIEYMCSAFMEGLRSQKYKLFAEMQEQYNRLAHEVKALRAENEELRSRGVSNSHTRS